MVQVNGLQQAFQKLAEQAADAAKPDASKPKAEDIAKFQEKVGQAGSEQNQAVGSADPLASQAADPMAGGTAAPVENASSPGDSILKGLQKMHDDYQESAQALADGSKQSMDPQEMLRVQALFQRSSIEVEFAGKVASKATQDVNQLLKNQ